MSNCCKNTTNKFRFCTVFKCIHLYWVYIQKFLYKKKLNNDIHTFLISKHSFNILFIYFPFKNKNKNSTFYFISIYLFLSHHQPIIYHFLSECATGFFKCLKIFFFFFFKKCCSYRRIFFLGPHVTN